MSLAAFLTEASDAPQALRRLVEAWLALDRAGNNVDVGSSGVDEVRQREFLEPLGLTFPRDLSLLYQHFGGSVLVRDGGIELYGWPPATLAEIGIPLADQAEADQVRWIGGDSGEQFFGVWLPRPAESPFAPALVAGEMAPDDQVIAAAGVVELLTEITVVELQYDRPEGTDAALDALGVPQNLRQGDPDDATYVNAVASWADPTLGYRGFYMEQHALGVLDLPAAIEALRP